MMSCYFRLNVTGFDTSLAEDEVEEMARGVFPGSYCSVLEEVVFVHLRGKDAVEKALILSGRSAGGFNLVVNAVLPLRKDSGGGVSLARTLHSSFFFFLCVKPFIHLYVSFRYFGYG